jgi:hypothetical protein
MAKVLVVPSLLTTIILGCHKSRKTNSTDSDLTCNVIWNSVGLQKKATHPTAECRRYVYFAIELWPHKKISGLERQHTKRIGVAP